MPLQPEVLFPLCGQHGLRRARSLVIGRHRQFRFELLDPGQTLLRSLPGPLDFLLAAGLCHPGWSGNTPDIAGRREEFDESGWPPKDSVPAITLPRHMEECPREDPRLRRIEAGASHVASGESSTRIRPPSIMATPLQMVSA